MDQRTAFRIDRLTWAARLAVRQEPEALETIIAELEVAMSIEDVMHALSFAGRERPAAEG